MGHFFTSRETDMIAADLAMYQVPDIRGQAGYMQELLTFPGTAAGKQFSYTIEWLNPVPEIENVIIQLYETALNKQISVQVHVSPDDREIATDRFFSGKFFSVFLWP